MAYWVPVGGQLYLAEIALLVLLIFNLHHLHRDRLALQLTVGALLWAIGLLFADISRGTDSFDAFKGQALIWMLLIDILAIRVLIKKSPSNAPPLMLGYGVASIAGYVLQPNPDAVISAWKFGVGIGVTYVAIYLLARLDPPLIVRAGALASLAITHLILGFRSESLIIMIVLALSIQRHESKEKRRGSVIVPVLLAIAALGIVAQTYSWLASSGRLGEDAEFKYMTQTSGELGSLAGRPEFVYSTFAIMNNPVIGLGANAADPGGIIQHGLQVEADLGFPPRSTALRAVPLHSHVLGALAQAGLFAVAFWAVVGATGVRAFSRLTRGSPEYRLIVSFVLVQTTWDVLFSPLGAVARFQFALGFAILASTLSRTDRQE